MGGLKRRAGVKVIMGQMETSVKEFCETRRNSGTVSRASATLSLVSARARLPCRVTEPGMILLGELHEAHKAVRNLGIAEDQREFRYIP
jgi:hypothetical protein